MRHAGILAHSAEGASLCFLSFCHEGSSRLGPHAHPDVTLDCIAMGRSMEGWLAGRHAQIRQTLAQSIERLALAGAEFFVCPDNTAHIALELAGRDLALPGLNIADVVAAEAARTGRRRIAVLGTRYTMDGPVYRRALADQGIGHELPAPDESALIDRVIFEELVEGRFEAASRHAYVEIIARMKQRGCDAAALVCTEIPLLVTPDLSPLPILDSTRLLARAALEVAIEERPLPTWRGGPPGQTSI